MKKKVVCAYVHFQIIAFQGIIKWYLSSATFIIPYNLINLLRVLLEELQGGLQTDTCMKYEEPLQQGLSQDFEVARHLWKSTRCSKNVVGGTLVERVVAHKLSRVGSSNLLKCVFMIKETQVMGESTIMTIVKCYVDHNFKLSLHAARHFQEFLPVILFFASPSKTKVTLQNDSHDRSQLRPCTIWPIPHLFEI